MEKFEEFEKLWTMIVNDLKKHLGQPTSENIESIKFSKEVIENRSDQDGLFAISEDSAETSWRDDIKWEDSGINVYLFMFGDNQTSYRQIRLAIYEE